jgi:hypothetical protein
MKTPKFKTFSFILLLAAIAIWSVPATAQEKAAPEKKPASEAAPAAAKKPSAGPFHGKLVALDKMAKTITVGKRTFQITSTTKIRKNDKPATLEDGVVGEECSGYIKPNEEGKLIATTVNFGPKNSQAKDSEKKASTPKTEAKPDEKK